MNSNPAKIAGRGALTIGAAALVFLALTTRLVSASPPTPNLTGTTPGSPANQNHPLLSGTTSASTIVRVYAGGSCQGSVIASGTSNAAGTFSIALSVADNTTTSFSAKASNASGVSGCSSPLTYIEDSAAPAAPIFRTIKRGFGGATQATIAGDSEPGSLVQLFVGDSCEGGSVDQAVTDLQGRFQIDIDPPGATTSYSALAKDGAANVSTCTVRPVVHNSVHPMCPEVPDHLPMTRTLKRGEHGALNYLKISEELSDGNCPDPYYDSSSQFDWDCVQQELEAYPPDLLGNIGLVTPFQTTYNGVIQGIQNAILGDDFPPEVPDAFEACAIDINNPCRRIYNTQNDPLAPQYPQGCHPFDPQLCTAAGADSPNSCIASPAQIQARRDALSIFNEDFSVRVYPYMDFGSQLFGNHIARTGFWKFWDSRANYENQVQLQLGPNPPDPTTWLLRYYDDNQKQDPAYPDELTGLSFLYAATKPRLHSAAHCRDAAAPTYYRYAVNVLSQGWATYWPEAVRQAALAGYRMVFLDNSIAKYCWNEECRLGFAEWQAQWLVDHGMGSQTRIFERSASLLYDSGFESDWIPYAEHGWRGNGSFMLPYAGYLEKDADAKEGLFSAKLTAIGLEGGNLFVENVPVPTELQGKKLRFSFYYKTAGLANDQASCIAGESPIPGGTGPLALQASSTWAYKEFDWLPNPSNWPESPPASPLLVTISCVFGGSGTLWLDQVHLRAVEADDAANLRYDPSFESEWVPYAGHGWKGNGAFMFPYAGYLEKDSDAKEGSFSAKLSSSAPEWANLFVENVAIPSNQQGKKLRLSFYYKTAQLTNGQVYCSAGEYPGPGGTGSQQIPISSTWVYKELDWVPNPGNPPSLVTISCWMNEAGTLWLDQMHLTPLDNGLASPSEASTDSRSRFRAYATYAYWDSIAGTRLPILREAGRSVDPEFDLLVNASAKQRRGASYFLVERARLEIEGPILEAGSSPGKYLPKCDPTEQTRWLKDPNLDPEPDTGSCFIALDGTRGSCAVTTPVIASNIVDYKTGYATKFPDEFSYQYQMNVRSESNYYPGPPAEVDYFYRQTPETGLLHFAEVAAFGGGAVADLLLNVAYSQFHDANIRLPLRQLGNDFVAWTAQHADLFECLASHADVGVAFHDQESAVPTGLWDATSELYLYRLAERLSERGILWDAVAGGTDVSAEALSRFGALIYFDVRRFSDQEADALTEYMQNGGVVLSIGAVGLYDELFRQRALSSGSAWPPIPLDPEATTFHPIGLGWLVSAPRPAGLTPSQWPGASGLDDIVDWIKEYYRDTVETLPALPSATVQRMRQAAWSGYRRQVLHLLNYDVPFGWQSCHTDPPSPPVLNSITVRLGAPTEWTPTQATLFSPESGVFVGSVPVILQPDDTMTFVVPSMHIYSVALIE